MCSPVCTDSVCLWEMHGHRSPAADQNTGKNSSCKRSGSPKAARARKWVTEKDVNIFDLCYRWPVPAGSYNPRRRNVIRRPGGLQAFGSLFPWKRRTLHHTGARHTAYEKSDAPTRNILGDPAWGKLGDPGAQRLGKIGARRGCSGGYPPCPGEADPS